MARPLGSNIPRLLPDNRLWLRPSAPQFLRGRQSCLDLLFDLTRLWDENETHREKTAHAADSEDRRGANKEPKADLTPLFLCLGLNLDDPSVIFLIYCRINKPEGMLS